MYAGTHSSPFRRPRYVPWRALLTGAGRLLPEEVLAGEKHRRRSLAGVGVLAAWLLLNAVGVVLL